ncbi:MAG: DUF5606 domain-containing protein [Bacteroidales bacterium]
MKTDLKKVLSVSGQQGLFMYISQANAGAIVESILTGKRTCYGLSARMTSLADISIFTTEDEIKLKDVLEKMHANLGDNMAPAGKSDAKILKSFFEEVIPNYDKDKFYASHMKKVVEWYNILKEKDLLDFEPLEEANSSKEPELSNEAK